MAEDNDTFELWTNPGCRVVCRLLKDGRYVLYRIDDPAVRLVLSLEEIRKVADLLGRLDQTPKR